MIEPEPNDKEPVESCVRQHARDADDERRADVLERIEAVCHDLDGGEAREAEGVETQSASNLQCGAPCTDPVPVEDFECLTFREI